MDGMKTITVTVTRKHFTAANKALAERKQSVKKVETLFAPRSSVCVVAQAVKELFPGEEVHVSWEGVRVGPWNAETKKFKLSKSATNLVYRFDGIAGKKLKASDFPIIFRMKEVETVKAAA